MSIAVKSISSANSDTQTTRVVLLNDHDGKVLVLLPANMLLNLVSIWKHSGRHLQPVRGSDATKFFSQSALKAEAGQAQLFLLPVFIDDSLKDSEHFHIVEAYTGLSFEAHASWFKGEVSHCPLGLTPHTIAQHQPNGSDEQVITRAVERFTTLRIQQRLEDTLGLPPLPMSMKRLVELRSDPSAGIDDLVPLIRNDASLAAQVMSWAASPYYAAPGDVHSVEDAVIRVLGFDLVVNLALGVAMGKTLTVSDDTPRDGVPYWRQAVYVAAAAELVCKKMPASIRPVPGFAYLAGLLQNFGYLVLAHLFPPHFALLSRYIEANPHMALEYVEKQVLNVTREQIGAWLLDNWGLPEVVVEAVRHHNDLSYDGVASHEAKLIYIVNRALRSHGLADGPVEDISASLLNELELSQAEVDSIVTSIAENTEELDALVHTIMHSHKALG
ncbi:HDOD domain-containing protein [Amphritea sp. 1_MG-2023]|uniref:aminoacyl-tRNA deacylase and HDOD domain-containing protein n=1 Tax=Amphritea sp. 1_MG-2023 TaxID=3062670 RepID=UPI0026E24685|nr:HDOD domain-containing protein [Amphritea sp. 1_MG-2023]MDO6565057.1 HDOD domain-containing protein [Amphritea sp. 1_MG-2023]